ncbi:MAG: nucleotidyltransferase family protein [Anaerospora sp.]|nr:nucleotidyltransferase family protein [Anaerospora sp.]
MRINGIILAAGLSSRMEAFKPLLKLKDKTIIECSIDSMLGAGVQQVVVVLGHRAQELETVLLSRYEHSRLVLVRNSHYAELDMLSVYLLCRYVTLFSFYLGICLLSIHRLF